MPVIAGGAACTACIDACICTAPGGSTEACACTGSAWCGSIVVGACAAEVALPTATATAKPALWGGGAHAKAIDAAGALPAASHGGARTEDK